MEESTVELYEGPHKTTMMAVSDKIFSYPRYVISHSLFSPRSHPKVTLHSRQAKGHNGQSDQGLGLRRVRVQGLLAPSVFGISQCALAPHSRSWNHGQRDWLRGTRPLEIALDAKFQI